MKTRCSQLQAQENEDVVVSASLNTKTPPNAYNRMNVMASIPISENHRMAPQLSMLLSPPVRSFFLKAFQNRSVSSPAPVTIT